MRAKVGAFLMSAEYDVSKIRVLQGLESVRARPGMYIGALGTRGLHFLVFEVVDNSIEEALAGYCKNIDISINADGSVTVSDDGRGIEDERDSETDTLSIEKMFTTLDTLKHRDCDYRVGSDLYGAGLAIISALSARLEVTVWQDRKTYNQRFERGVAVSTLESFPSNDDRTGVATTFIPDLEIFTDGIEFEFDRLGHRFRELAFLHAGLRLSLIDRRCQPARAEDYYYPDGLRDYLHHLNRDKQPFDREIFYISEKRDEMLVKVALQWCQGDRFDCILSYANTTPTIDGGKHVEGLKRAISSTINTLARQRHKIPADAPNLDGGCIRSGLVGIISVFLPNTEWAGPTRTKLATSAAETIVDSIVTTYLTQYLIDRPQLAERIIDNAIAETTAMEIARQNRTARKGSIDK
jgi:DNA gyrase subunit B